LVRRALSFNASRKSADRPYFLSRSRKASSVISGKSFICSRGAVENDPLADGIVAAFCGLGGFRFSLGLFRHGRRFNAPAGDKVQAASSRMIL
jgi:hypothetical protein